MRLLLLEVKQPDCPVVRVSERFKEAEIYTVESRAEGDLLRVFLQLKAGNRECLSKLMNALAWERSVASFQVIGRGKKSAIVKFLCKQTQASECLNSMNGVVFHYPLYTTGGKETWVVAVEGRKAEDEVINCLRRRNEVRLIERHKLPATSPLLELTTLRYLNIPEILTELRTLTDTQMKALEAAVRLGYYDSPRRSGLRELAEHLGVSRAAAEKTLRAAESKVMHALLPLLAKLSEHRNTHQPKNSMQLTTPENQ